jgi:hypothetical protein
MIAVEERHKGLGNYPDPDAWTAYFSSDGWRVTANRVMPPGIDRRKDVQILAKHKYAQWGHLIVERTA